MSSEFRETERDPTPRPPQIIRWPSCSCKNVAKGECTCYVDDGMVTHGGVRREGRDHGNYPDADHLST